ncbi:methyltransferase domain-containing protein [Halobacillus litoralis]|uniref:class I SAM-dependent methyltransferase n=1 Tax=Halobacillus litoralis TaxID=45668 RepID=UPI001CD37AED|nr:class I SAM-dependent methyltransferase [Halobacillus litoralis]MCA0969287.1 methyltransferase domain-containing protein [Halobacillus litoralis]
MGIDFHSLGNQGSYRSRKADDSWKEMMEELVTFPVERAADIGCGGGIYSQGLAELGAKAIYGVDQSEVSLEDAGRTCAGTPNAFFQKGKADDTGLDGDSFDVVLERALIHHLSDLEACFLEAKRVLKPGGVVVIQDRTPEDCFLPGSEVHLRGYMMDRFPELKEVEASRRHTSEQVTSALTQCGFTHVQEMKLWETRKTYVGKDELRQDILSRTGRSILHELSDDELVQFADELDDKLKDGPVVEKDRWAIWIARK